MALFSHADMERIGAAIAEAEKHTAGEIVVVVARSASSYSFVPALWATLLALALPWPLLRFTALSAERIYLLQLIVFLAVAVLLWLLPNRAALVPGYIRRRRAHQEALEQFLAQGMVRTAHRTGCLIYVAEAERYAEVLADEAIASRVDVEVWKETIELLTDALKQDRAVDGFVRAIARCGKVLAEHAPPKKRNANELPDRVILL